jgi:GPH family glycoside/pentoside/hexuronide:cation symporter
MEKQQNPFYYAISNLGIFLLYSFPATYLFFYFNETLGFSVDEDAIRFLLISIGLVVGIFAGPVFGVLSDKTKSRFGKRRIWMIIFSPLTGILFVLLVVPFFTDFTSALIYLIIIYILYSIVINALNTPYLGLMADVTLPEKRTQMSGLYGLLGGVGTGLGLLLPFIIIKFIDSYLIVCSIYAIILIATNLITILKIKEPEKPLMNTIEEKIPFKEVLKNRNFIIFEICQFFWNMAFNLVIAALGPISVAILGLPSEDEFGPLAALLLGIIGIFFLIYLRKGDKWGKKRTMTFALIYIRIVFPFGAIFAITKIFGFMLIQGIVFITLLAAGLAAVFVFPMSIVMDLIKKEQEASYMGVNSIFMNASGAAGTFIMFLMISFFGMVNAFYIICPLLGALLLIAGIIFKFKLKIKKPETDLESLD